MEREKLSRQAPAAFYGVLLALFCFMLAFSQILLTFCQQQNRAATLTYNLVIASLTAAAYLGFEIHFHRISPSSVFALSYFFACAAMTALSFHFIASFDFVSLFNNRAGEVVEVFRVCCFQLCAVEGVTLTARVGWEISSYIRRLKQ